MDKHNLRMNAYYFERFPSHFGPHDAHLPEKKLWFYLELMKLIIIFQLHIFISLLMEAQEIINFERSSPCYRIRHDSAIKVVHVHPTTHACNHPRGFGSIWKFLNGFVSILPWKVIKIGIISPSPEKIQISHALNISDVRTHWYSKLTCWTIVSIYFLSNLSKCGQGNSLQRLTSISFTLKIDLW